jgi:hypothetical protein
MQCSVTLPFSSEHCKEVFFFVLSSSPFFSNTWQDVAEVGDKMVNKYVNNYRKKSLVLIQSEFSDDSNCDGDSSCEIFVW